MSAKNRTILTNDVIHLAQGSDNIWDCRVENFLVKMSQFIFRRSRSWKAVDLCPHSTKHARALWHVPGASMVLSTLDSSNFKAQGAVSCSNLITSAAHGSSSCQSGRDRFLVSSNSRCIREIIKKCENAPEENCLRLSDAGCSKN
jgi:hypothetical protein